MNLTKITLKVDGMSCAHCVGHVTEALEALEGVVNPVVALDKGLAEFEAAPGFDVTRAVAAIEEAGYSASVI